jgi:hypothetical protein
MSHHLRRQNYLMFRHPLKRYWMFFLTFFSHSFFPLG